VTGVTLPAQQGCDLDHDGHQHRVARPTLEGLPN